MYNFINHSLIS